MHIDQATLQVGELMRQISRTEIRLPERAFQHWDGGWRTEAGDFRLTVGRSVADRPLALVLSPPW